MRVSPAFILLVVSLANYAASAMAAAEGAVQVTHGRTLKNGLRGPPSGTCDAVTVDGKFNPLNDSYFNLSCNAALQCAASAPAAQLSAFLNTYYLLSIKRSNIKHINFLQRLWQPTFGARSLSTVVLLRQRASARATSKAHALSILLIVPKSIVEHGALI
jgi:hypothetical protein